MTDNRSALKIRKDVIAMIEQHTPGRWTMDKCPDAHGFSTIRPSDGSINGDTDAQPIATVYRPDHALLIATAPETAAERDRLRAVNADLLALLGDVVSADQFYMHDVSRSTYLREIAFKARTALAKEKGEET